jgi:antitoxin component of RelBE/YafQ-DinJ toxin-antitoxin module
MAVNKLVNIRVSDLIYEKLQSVADERGLTRSEIARHLLSEALTKKSEDKIPA